MISATFAYWVCAAGIIVKTATVMAAPEQSSQPGRIRSNDTQLRQWAIASPRPAYPRSSLSNRVTGVVVAAIRTTPKGEPEGVEILQSPDDDTGRAVHDALMQWTFRPLSFGVEGTVVFYFHIEGTRAVVLSPAEMREVTNPGTKNVARADEPPVRSLTRPEYQALSNRVRTVVLDVRDRQTFAEGHEEGAVNIPFGEILARAAAELRVSRPVVIDCRDPDDVCAMVAHQLTSSGFSRVSILRR